MNQSRVSTDSNLDRLMGALLLLAIALLALLIGGWVAGAGPEAATTHPDFAPMQHGVDAGALGAPAWTGYLVGLIVIGMLWVTLVIGFRDGHWIRRAVTVWTVWYGVAFVALMRSYSAYELGETRVIAGFSEPSAWLVYGLGLSPWILLITITLVFERGYFGADEQAQFDEILAARKADS